MVHFKGFDTFIESNEQDFIIYLNIFAFYNSNEYFQMEITLFSRKIYGNMSRSISWTKPIKLQHRGIVLLAQRIYYVFERKDKSTEEQASVSSSSSSFSFVEEVYATPDLRQSTHSRNSSITSENEFKQKYPSIKELIRLLQNLYRNRYHRQYRHSCHLVCLNQ